MNVLGISAYFHDSAACLVSNGEVVAAAQEERFTRRKHDAAFPTNAIRYCLTEGGFEASAIDRVVFYDKPFLKFERLFETYLAFAPKGFVSFAASFPLWIKDKLFQRRTITQALKSEVSSDIDWNPRVLFSEHHLSHAASAFFPSPFDEAAVLTLDGVGEWTTTSLAIGQGSSLSVLREIHFPHSLGLLYSAFTFYTGFKVNSGEYKVMGLAPYGQPRYADLIKSHLVDIKDDGSFHLDLQYFDYCTGLQMTNARFAKLFGAPARKPDEPLEQRHMDLAASIQAVTEEIVLKLAKSVRRSSGQRNLCLAGGVALNCVANGKILREGIFDRIWIQPASGDAGGALGAALAASHMTLGVPRIVDSRDAMKGSLLGPSFEQSDIERRLSLVGAKYEVVSDDQLTLACATALAEGKVLGWHQGRMEFGPRALGARSILADPRSPEMQRQLNLKIKYRESFRPFAPAVLGEAVSDWFEMDTESPYMLLVADVKSGKRLSRRKQEDQLFGIDRLNVPRSQIPAVTHVDYSARVQTVSADWNSRFHALITKFGFLTGCPVLVNTSFNVRGEPIVNTPEDAFRCFMGTEIDMLVVGNCVLRKEVQSAKHHSDYKSAHEPD